MKAARTDIQALRGLAVLLVVLYHARIGPVAAGYLGVDVFFVISGFLITGLVKNGIERDDFTFTEFYLRRAKRLLPAAYVTFFATAVLAPLFLGGSELRDFAGQMLGAVTFTGNIVLWNQSGYFAGAAELKPLLHVWSLAIEEQYYLLLPAALVFSSSKRWLKYAIAVFVVSAALCVVGGLLKPVATFYLLPTRAWELAIGSIAVLSGRYSRLEWLDRNLIVPAVVALIVIPFVPMGGIQPGADALAVCLATAIVIRRNHRALNSSATASALARVGDLSYSLYLVHWPIFAFAKNAWAYSNWGQLSLEVRLGLLLLSFVLAYVLNRFVETPVRYAKFRFTPRALAITLAVSLGLIALPQAALRILPAHPEIAVARRLNLGFGQACEFGAHFDAKAECRNSDTPSILVWGDSYAMHLVLGIVASSEGRGVVQATRSVCGPLLDIAPLDVRPAARDNGREASDCIAFNASVVEYLVQAPFIHTVVLSSPFQQYLGENGSAVMRRTGERLSALPERRTAAEQGLARTISAIRSTGKHVVIVAPPPSTGFDIAGCLERRATGKLLFGAPPSCAVSAPAYRRSKWRVLSFLARAQAQQGVPVFSFDSLLCNARWCKTTLDGTFLYRDDGHLSRPGSVLIGRQLSLAARLEAMAR